MVQHWLLYLMLVKVFIRCESHEYNNPDNSNNLLSLSQIPNDLCFKHKRFPRIPNWHIASSKTAPLIIAHRGNIIEYQENSLEGITSLIGKGIDGVEFDVFLTKDKQLVVIHDENTLRMTGENALIWNLTVAEIRKLNLKKIVKYSDEYIYNYSRPLKIPLLKDVLKALAKSDMLMYIEIKPYNNPLRSQNDLERALETGKMVAEMVTDMKLEDKVFIVSFEPIKLWAAKRENHHLITGMFTSEEDWKLRSDEYIQMKKYYKKILPGLSKCLDSLPNNSSLMDFLFSSGTLLRSIQATLLDVSGILFLDPRINQGKNIVTILKNSLVPTVSFGSGIVYYVKNPKTLQAKEDGFWHSLIKQGVARLLTDDPLRLKRTIGRAVSHYRKVWNGHILNGHILKISCTHGRKINISYAMYGRIGREFWRTIYCKGCHTLKIMMKKYCQEKTICSIKASNEIFGIPCQGVHKYLMEKYTCA